MRALTMQRRYARVLPAVLAIVVASAVTAIVAFVVLPADDDPQVQVSSEVAGGSVGQLASSPDTSASDGNRTAGDAATETPEASVEPTIRAATEVPRPTRTATPALTSTPALSPTPAASPTRRPPAAANNLVSNGGFSNEFDSWYTEGDVTIAATGGRNGGPALRIGPSAGYADSRLPLEAGHSYRLQAWGQVSTPGQVGIVGFQYFDADGNRLESAEPTPLTFDQTTTVRKALQFTFPENVARVHVYLWNQGGLSVLTVDDVSVREIIPQDGENTQAIG